MGPGEKGRDLVPEELRIEVPTEKHIRPSAEYLLPGDIFEGEDDVDKMLSQIAPEINELSSDTQVMTFLQDTFGEAAKESYDGRQTEYPLK